jgi:CheY-like chemotaxis protein
MKTLKCILLVDDDEINNIICYSHINRLGIAEKIQTARNGLNALNFLRRYHIQYRSLPELIILDIEMPVMDGMEFLKAFNNSFFIESTKRALFS